MKKGNFTGAIVLTPELLEAEAQDAGARSCAASSSGGAPPALKEVPEKLMKLDPYRNLDGKLYSEIGPPSAEAFMNAYNLKRKALPHGFEIEGVHSDSNGVYLTAAVVREGRERMVVGAPDGFNTWHDFNDEYSELFDRIWFEFTEFDPRTCRALHCYRDFIKDPNELINKVYCNADVWRRFIYKREN